jgi:hypothetical protein
MEKPSVAVIGAGKAVDRKLATREPDQLKKRPSGLAILKNLREEYLASRCLRRVVLAGSGHIPMMSKLLRVCHVRYQDYHVDNSLLIQQLRYQI